MADILIVEDEKLLNEAYVFILKNNGHTVRTAFDGAEGLKQFKVKAPDLMLLDLRMPKMSGVELLMKLDIPGKYPKTKVIVFSNYDEQKEIDDSFKYGATRYMLKAWASPKELVKVVSETLAS